MQRNEMPHFNDTQLAPRDVARILADHPRRWIVPMLLCGALAFVYALFSSDTWEASQALIIRHEGPGVQERASHGSDPGEMKTVQETVLELVKSRTVLHAALEQVGPARTSWFRTTYPTDSHVEGLRDALTMTPPNGAEFGQTEIFYLKVKNNKRERALELVSAVCEQLQDRFQVLRQAKAQSLIDEMERSAQMAEGDLAEATSELGALEAQVGADLSELRMLHASSSGNSDLRQKLIAVENEIRGYEAEQRDDEQLLELLKAAENDPGQFLASPNSLLEAQPSLRRLKDGLVDAQLQAARLQGSMSDAHPQVIAARASEQQIRGHLQDELSIAIEGIQVDLRLMTDRVNVLKTQQRADRARLERLAALRADYANLVAKTENRTELLESARRNLADAHADQATARGVSLISAIDAPDTGTRPLGPGGKSVVLGGLACGLLLGLGIVFLTVDPAVAQTTASLQMPWQADADADDDADSTWENAEAPAVAHPEPENLSLKEALLRLHEREATTPGN